VPDREGGKAGTGRGWEMDTGNAEDNKETVELGHRTESSDHRCNQSV